MAQDTIAFLDKLVGGPAHLVGYSAGAAVALRVAVDRPDLVDRLVLISGAFHRDGMLLRPTADAAPPAQLVAAYAEVSPDGAGHLPVVIAKLARSAAEEPGLTSADLGAVACPTLVMAGDDDIARFEHTIELYDAIPDAQLAVIPGASHVVPVEKADLLNQLVLDFLAAEGPTMTMAPIRRG